MADDKLVEAMARAIEGLNPTWKDAEAEARAALAAIEATGYKIIRKTDDGPFDQSDSHSCAD